MHPTAMNSLSEAPAGHERDLSTFVYERRLEMLGIPERPHTAMALSKSPKSLLEGMQSMGSPKESIRLAAMLAPLPAPSSMGNNGRSMSPFHSDSMLQEDTLGSPFAPPSDNAACDEFLSIVQMRQQQHRRRSILMIPRSNSVSPRMLLSSFPLSGMSPKMGGDALFRLEHMAMMPMGSSRRPSIQVTLSLETLLKYPFASTPSSQHDGFSEDRPTVPNSHPSNVIPPSPLVRAGNPMSRSTHFQSSLEIPDEDDEMDFVLQAPVVSRRNRLRSLPLTEEARGVLQEPSP